MGTLVLSSSVRFRSSSARASPTSTCVPAHLAAFSAIFLLSMALLYIPSMYPPRSVLQKSTRAVRSSSEMATGGGGTSSLVRAPADDGASVRTDADDDGVSLDWPRVYCLFRSDGGSTPPATSEAPRFRLSTPPPPLGGSACFAGAAAGFFDGAKTALAVLIAVTSLLSA